MKLNTILFAVLILSAIGLSAFGLPSAPQVAVPRQETVSPSVTLVPPTVDAVTTPGVIPVTGEDASANRWTLVLFGLLGLLGLAFLVALFSPRTTQDNDR